MFTYDQGRVGLVRILLTVVVALAAFAAPLDGHAINQVCWYEYPDGTTLPADGGPTDLPPVTAMVGVERCFDLDSLGIHDRPHGPGNDIPSNGGGVTDTQVGEEIQKDEADPCKKSGNPSTGRPVIIASGVKILPELDFTSGHGELAFGVARFYTKSLNRAGIFGRRWSSNIEYSLSFQYGEDMLCEGRLGIQGVCAPGSRPLTKIHAYRGTGFAQEFTRNAAGAWVSKYGSSLTLVGSNWKLLTAHGREDSYDAQGRPLSVVNERGVGVTYTYSGGKVWKLTHSNGRSISFTWSGDRISAISNTAGKSYSYSYTANGYLSGVAYPDSLGARGYVYEDPAQPGGLTGITVNGVRHSKYSYYADGRVKKSGLGATGDFEASSFSYGANYVNVTNGLGQTTKYLTAMLDGARRHIGTESPISAACPQGGRLYTAYDASGNIDYTIDGYGVKTDLTYDSDDRLIQKVVGIGINGETNQQQITQWVWDSTRKGRLLSVKVFAATLSQKITETTYAYYPDGDARARLLSSVIIKNLSSTGVLNSTQVTSFNYTIHANKLVATMTVDGPIAGAGDAVVYSYDSAGNLTSIKNSLNHSVLYANYNALGLPGRITSENGAVVEYTYDARGNTLTQGAHVNGTVATTSFEYDSHGRVKKVTHSDGAIFNYVHALNGKISQVSTSAPVPIFESADGKITETLTTLHNLAGVPTQIVRQKHWIARELVCIPECYIDPETGLPGPSQLVPKSEITQSEFVDYDPSGFVKALRGNNGQNVRYTYDANGNVKTITDSLNRVTTLTYDRQQNVVKSVGPLSQTATFEYDQIGRLTKVIDPRSRPTTYVYDGFGQLWSQTSPDTGTTTFEYNTGGLRTKMTRQSGAVTSFTYDGLGRPIAAAAGGQAKAFSYDTCANGKSRLCQVSDPTGSVSYTYTPQGLLASQSSAMPASGSATYAYTYDTSGRLVGIAYPGSVAVGYGYANGRLSTVTATISGVSRNVVSNLRHRPFGPAESWNFGNGLTRGLNYDLDGRVTELNTRNGINYLQRLGYQYTAHNEINGLTNHVHSSLNQAYAYDQLSRLTSVTASGENQALVWDLNGNRTSHLWGGQTDIYTTNSNNNRLTAIGGPRATSYTYDADGNTLSGEGASYTYNPFNRLASAVKSGVTTTYAVNALGQRVHKKVGAGANHWFTYGPSGRLLAEHQSGAWTQYVRLPDGTLVARVRGGKLFMIHTDHLGRPEIVTNDAKAVVWRASNYAFNRTVTLDSIGGLNLGFPGQYHDAETGLAYNYYRTYNPRTGRYLESDPIGLAGGLNTYSYVESNPISYIDPWGLQGHHYVPRQIFNQHNFSPEARRVFEKGTTGRVTHYFDRGHRSYNKAVGDLVADFLKRNSIDPSRMTAEQAQQCLDEVRNSQRDEIKNYLDHLKSGGGLFRAPVLPLCVLCEVWGQNLFPPTDEQDGV